ncbi:nucleoside-binding protein [Catenovulum sediminis]|uniref:nucleoside-binding protein n=1 Tax=Catenovulum sediminis TaxID=1740262 RepID=UPI001C8F6176|nr:nucleoside-binding protein [Catenovulum sediminis]
MHKIHSFLFHLFVISTMLISVSLSAKTLWSDFSLTALKGKNYQIGDKQRDVFTMEYAAGLNWGDIFVFVDRLQSDNGDSEIYGELSPRISLFSWSDSALQHISFASTIEFKNFTSAIGEGQDMTNYLFGIGSKFQPAYFKFLNVNIYRRFNEFGSDNMQVTLAWALPVGPFYYDGFIDFTNAKDNKSASQNFTSQFKYNLAPIMGITSKFFVGVEYVHWNNKFGLKGINERNINLLAKFHF